MGVEELYFYDIETFPNYFLLVGKYANSECTIVENPSLTELLNFINKGRLIGFNNHKFDDVVLSSMINKALAERVPLDEPLPARWAYDFGQEIINADVNVYFQGLDMVTEDVMKYRDFETNALNLKAFGNMLGLPIVESQFDFHQDVNELGKKLTVEYCINDVITTQKAYEFLEKRGSVSAVETLRQYVADKLGENSERYVKKSTNSLLINLIKNPSYDRSKFFEYMEKCDFSYAMADPNFKDWYEHIVNWVDDPLKLNEPVLEFVSHNMLFKFGKGGGHGHSLQLMFENLFDIDVASLYPSILINILGLGEETALFKEIVETRVANKKTNPKLASGLKLFINSLYGLTRSATSGAQLYDAHLGLDICIAGQVMLYDLALRMVEIGATLVNFNTDGIYYQSNGFDIALDEMVAEFSERTNLQFDKEHFDYYFAKDVNNYFIYNKQEDGSLKLSATKGVFGKKPFFNNYASSYHTMEHFKHQILKKQTRSMTDIYKENPDFFTVRLKNTRQFELHQGLVYTFERYGAKGQLLKKQGEEFVPVNSLGHHFRGYATKDNIGYRLQNLNAKTGKFTEIGTLATKKHPSNFIMSLPSIDELNFDYYQEPANNLIDTICSNALDFKLKV